ncbi:hypothetical protein L218DRAFT_961100 [Marasmius fiardii PR-910]|nr:hypothetical protein L218DRAFT_961100 [Marasmius fiardii PR-910]
MHALLPVSALHLHHLQPNAHYLSLAISHKNYVSPLLPQTTNSDILILVLSFFHAIEFADPRPSACGMFLIVGNIHKNFIGRELAHPSLKSFNFAKQARSFGSLNTGPIHLTFPASLNRIHFPNPPSASSSPLNMSSNEDFPWPDSEELSDPVTSSTTLLKPSWNHGISVNVPVMDLPLFLFGPLYSPSGSPYRETSTSIGVIILLLFHSRLVSPLGIQRASIRTRATSSARALVDDWANQVW